MQGDRAVIDLLNEVLTGELLDHILEGEDGHADWLETQLELVRQIGEAHYLAQQIRS